MLIYQAPSDRFIDDVRGNTISDIMSENYKAGLGKDPGGRERIVPHPSQQVKEYHNYSGGLLRSLRKNLPSPCSVVPIVITTQEQKEQVCTVLFTKT